MYSGGNWILQEGSRNEILRKSNEGEKRRNDDIRKELRVKSVNEFLKDTKLMCFRHLKRGRGKLRTYEARPVVGIKRGRKKTNISVEVILTKERKNWNKAKESARSREM